MQITREEAISYFKRHIDLYCVTGICREAEEMAIEALKEPKKGEWIPVERELPKENETVMASCGQCVFPEARYSKKDGWEWAYESGADYWEKLDDVEAWQPLPKPYKAESEV